MGLNAREYLLKREKDLRANLTCTRTGWVSMTTMAQGMLRRALGVLPRLPFLLFQASTRSGMSLQTTSLLSCSSAFLTKVKHLNFPRLFVLYKLWISFYIQAKYGNEKLNIAAADLFQREEAELALRRAGAWTNAANVLAGVYG